MKSLKRFLCTVLTLSLLISAVTFTAMASAPANAPDYDITLFDVPFTAGAFSQQSGKFNVVSKPSTIPSGDYWCNNQVVSAATEGINGAAEHGDVARYSIAAPESLTDNSAAKDNYLRIDYTTDANNIVKDYYPAYKDMLEYSKATLDIYLPSDGFKNDINIRAYSRMSPVSETSLKQDGIIFISPNPEGGNAIVSVRNGANTSLKGNIFELDKWITLELYLNMNNDTFDVYADGVVIAENHSFDALKGDVIINSFGFQNGAVKKEYTVYFDNFKYEVASPYASTIAELDFEELTTGTTVTAGDNTYSLEKKGTGAASPSFEVATADGNNYAKLYGINVDSQGLVGMAPEAMQNYYTYEKYGKMPEKVKIELDVRNGLGFSHSNYIYFHIGGNRLIMWRGSDGDVQHFTTATAKTSFATKTKKYADTGVGFAHWFKFDIYIDFIAGKFQVYCDGDFIGEADLPNTIAELSNLTVGTNGTTAITNYFCIDNMKISTIAPFGNNTIADYVDYTKDATTGVINGAEKKVGYVLNNDGDEALAYKIITAKFNAGTDRLDSIVSITDGSVAQGKMELKELTTQTATDGYYYKYFIWDNMNTLNPLVENVFVK